MLNNPHVNSKQTPTIDFGFANSRRAKVSYLDFLKLRLLKKFGIKLCVLMLSEFISQIYRLLVCAVSSCSLGKTQLKCKVLFNHAEIKQKRLRLF